jgi:hypothetical protein
MHLTPRVRPKQPRDRRSQAMGKRKKARVERKKLKNLRPRDAKASGVTGGGYLQYKLENAQITSYQLG